MISESSFVRAGLAVENALSVQCLERTKEDYSASIFFLEKLNSIAEVFRHIFMSTYFLTADIQVKICNFTFTSEIYNTYKSEKQSFTILKLEIIELPSIAFIFRYLRG